MPGHRCIHARDRHQDNPGEQPYRNEYFAHQAKEPDEKIGIHAIDGFDVLIICFKER
jgi:hypothetical protein